MQEDYSIYETLLNIPNLTVERIELAKKRLDIYCKIEQKESQACPSCQLSIAKRRPKYRRIVRDLDVSGRKVFLHLLVHQYDCECGRTFSEIFDFALPSKSYTNRQAKYVFELSAKQSHLQAAAISDMSHKTVERICYSQVSSNQYDWSKVKRIGIDEFSFKKGHKDYITVLINLDTHEIIDILEKRDKSYLRSYFQGLPDGICNQIEEFCSDMWGPFQDLGKELFPNALIHVDRFHWTNHLNKVLDGFRKKLRRDDKDQAVFKGLKWKLIKRSNKLNEQDKKELQAAFELSPELEILHKMRDDFQSIFDNETSYEWAVFKVNIWLEKAKKLENKYLNKFTDLFNRHKINILNYCKTRLSSGAVEGTNNLLRTVKRFTFNMSNFQNFKMRVFAYSQ